MLSVADLWSLVDREAQPLAPVRVPLGESLGRRLAEDIPADVDMPAFSRSAIYGYAVSEGSAPSGGSGKDLHGIRAARFRNRTRHGRGYHC